MGNATGHYLLELNNAQHRLALQKLAEISNVERRQSRANPEWDDTSQHGNWENFRNAKLNGKHFVLSSNWFVVIPKTGKIEFDYVSTKPAAYGARALSFKRFSTLIKKLGLEELDQVRLKYGQNDGLKKRTTGFFSHARRGSGAYMIQEENDDDYHSSSESSSDGSSSSTSTSSSESDSSTDSDDSMREMFGYEIPRCILTKDYVTHWRDLKASTHAISRMVGEEAARNLFESRLSKEKEQREKAQAERKKNEANEANNEALLKKSNSGKGSLIKQKSASLIKKTNTLRKIMSLRKSVASSEEEKGKEKGEEKGEEKEKEKEGGSGGGAGKEKGGLKKQASTKKLSVVKKQASAKKLSGVKKQASAKKLSVKGGGGGGKKGGKSDIDDSTGIPVPVEDSIGDPAADSALNAAESFRQSFPGGGMGGVNVLQKAVAVNHAKNIFKRQLGSGAVRASGGGVLGGRLAALMSSGALTNGNSAEKNEEGEKARASGLGGMMGSLASVANTAMSIKKRSEAMTAALYPPKPYVFVYYKLIELQVS